MFTRDRAEDHVFDANERMYRRYVESDLVQGKYDPTKFGPFPICFNRGKHSEPDDVTFSEDGKYDGYGVLECAAGKLAITIPVDEQLAFHFLPVHKPESDNYSHSEIWANRNEESSLSTPSSKARKLYRTIAARDLFVTKIARKVSSTT